MESTAKAHPLHRFPLETLSLATPSPSAFQPPTRPLHFRFSAFQPFSLSAFQPFSLSAFQLFSFSAFQLFSFSAFQPFSLSAFQPFSLSDFQLFSFYPPTPLAPWRFNLFSSTSTVIDRRYKSSPSDFHSHLTPLATSGRARRSSPTDF
jgi:hypothetical protein